MTRNMNPSFPYFYFHEINKGGVLWVKEQNTGITGFVFEDELTYFENKNVWKCYDLKNRGSKSKQPGPAPIQSN